MSGFARLFNKSFYGGSSSYRITLLQRRYRDWSNPPVHDVTTDTMIPNPLPLLPTPFNRGVE